MMLRSTGRPSCYSLRHGLSKQPSHRPLRTPPAPTSALARSRLVLSGKPIGPSRLFFSLPSFPPPSPGCGDVNGPEDLAVKDRYSKQGDLLVYKETKRLPYTKEQLYNVVADVESYSKFLPYCVGSRLNSHRALGENSETEKASSKPGGRPWLEGGYSGETHLLEMDLSIGFKNFQERYTSQVECRKWDTVRAISHHPSLFKHLSSTWTFKTPAEISFAQAVLEPNNKPEEVKSAYVSLRTAFAFANPLHAAVSELFWKAVSERLVIAFEDRLAEIYGPSKKGIKT